ncbi:MAG: HYR domain-containing protein, partial [Bacteroidetes bacterium]|nr:HYR domain-containing protein [Bacteroidota bacterium]
MRKVLLRTICFLSVVAVLLSAISTTATPLTGDLPIAHLPLTAIKDATFRKPVSHTGRIVAANKASFKKVAEPQAPFNPVCGVNTVSFTTPGFSAFTVPAGVTKVTITAVGAAGGNYSEDGGATVTNAGGLGAKVKGSFAVTAGDNIVVLVGGKGNDNTDFNYAPVTVAGGGGGGTFVAKDNFAAALPLLAAGGGGGAGTPAIGDQSLKNANIPNVFGALVNYANNGIQSDNPLDLWPASGDGGVAGSAGSGGDAAGGGAGWLLSGDNDVSASMILYGYQVNTGGIAPRFGGNSGEYAFGGQGGIGGGGSSAVGGGGGGGFSGGGGGGVKGDFIAELNGAGGASTGLNGGGGGSYNGGLDGTQENTPGVGTENGYVIIEYTYVAPIVTGGKTIFCAGETSAYSNGCAVPGITYTWYSSNPGVATVSNTGTVTAIAAGTTTITLTDNYGSFSSVNITVNATPVVAAISGATSVAVGATSALTSTTGGGIWSSNNTAIATVNASTGLVSGISVGTATISYIVTNGSGCSTTVTTDVTVNSGASPLTPGTIGSPQTICSGLVAASLSSAAEASGGTGTIAYQWQSSTDNSNFTNIPGATSATYAPGALTTTTYYRRGASTATDPVQYTSSVTVQVNALPNVTVTPSTTSITSGNNVTLTAGGANTYSWSPATALSATTGSVVVANPTSTITYTVTGVDNNGCSKTATAVVTVTAPLVPAKALNFDGVDDYVSSPGLTTTTTTKTFSAWVKLNNVSQGGGAVVSLETATGSVFDAIVYNESGQGWGFGSDGWSRTAWSGVLETSTNTWVHLAATYSANDYRLYRNGVLILQTNTFGLTSFPSNSRILIGKRHTGGSNAYLNASIDEVSVWNRVLCQAEIQNNMNCELNPAGQNGLVALYHLNQGNINANNAGINTAIDAGVNALTGSLNNFTLNGLTSNWTDGTVAGTCAVFNPPTAPVTGNTSVCIGSTTTLSNANSGTWSSSNSLIASVNASGVVTGVAQGTANIIFTTTCGGVSQVSVTVNSLPVVTANHAGFGCVNDKIELFSSPGASYSWTGPNGFTSNQQNPVILNSTLANAGTYTVTVTNASGCSASASTTVAVKALPVITALSNSPVCEGATLTLNANGGVDYFWTGPNGFVANNSQNPSINTVTLAAAGTYTVKGAGANGCNSDATVTVIVNPVPVVYNVTGSGDICTTGQGWVVNLSGSEAGVRYELWKNGSATGITLMGTGNPLVLGPLQVSGTFTVVATNTTTNCASKMSGSTTVNLTSPVTPMFTQVAAICSGANLAALPTTSNNGISGTWSPALNNNTTTTYTFTPSAGQCASETTMTITVKPLPSVTITASGPTTFCPGGSVTLTASAGTSYLWSNGETTQSITVSSSGSYTVTVTNASDCSATSAATVVTVQDIVAPVAPVLAPITAECSATVPVPTATDNCAGTIAGTTSDPLTYNTQGSYTVHWTFHDGNGNSTTAEQLVTILDVTPPSIVCPANISVSATSPLGAVVTFMAPIGIDNCAGVSTSQTAGLASGTIFPIGTTTQTYTVTDAAGNTVSCSFTVTVTCVPPVATISADGPTTFCAGGSVTLTASAGNSYLWSNGATTQTITVSTAGSYSVTVSNGACAATSAATSVTVNALPVVSINSNGSLKCEGGSFTFGASLAGQSYAWTGPNGFTSNLQINTINNVTAANAGLYSVVVTNVNGCSSNGAENLIVNSLPMATITAGGPTTFCPGGSVTLTASAGTSYLWSNGATTQSITVSSSGSYTVTVTNASDCSATSAATVVTVQDIVAPVTPVLPTITAECSVTVPVPSTTDNCAGIVTGTTSDPTTYTTQGTYTIHWTFNDGNGNSTTANQTVIVQDITPPSIVCPANISVSATSALGAVVTFVAPVGTDNCAGVTTSQTAGLASGAMFPIGTTTQTYTVTDAAGHVISCSFTVTVICVPPVVTISADGPTTFCAGGSVTLTASAGNSYLWSNGATTQTITVSTAGSYNVTVSNGACAATSAVTTVTVNPLPVVSINSNGSLKCEGESFTFGTSLAGQSYAWTGPNGFTSASQINTINSVSAINAGLYSVVVTNENGCTSTGAENLIVNPLPAATIIAGGPTTFCPGGSVTLTASAGSSYLWNNGATSQSITVNASGSYSVSISNGTCSATSAATVVTVQDTTPPVAPVLPTITAACSVTVPVPSATDNCSGTIIGTTNDLLSYNAQGDYTITWIFTDASGNTSTAQQHVIISDVVKPVISCPADIILTANTTVNNVAGATATYNAGASDNCGVQSITYSIAPGSFFPIGTTPVTVTVTDVNGNTQVCTFNVVVNCVIPVFTQCATNQTVNTDAGLCTAVVNYTASANGLPAANLSFTFSGATTGSGAGTGSGAIFNKGVTTVTISATNICGTVTCIFTVEVVDNENPVIVNTPANINQSNDPGQCGAVINWTVPTATDNCPGVTLVSSHQPGTVFPVGTTVVTYTATDASGHIVISQFSVTVTDDENPIITIPADITHSADAGQCSYTFGSDNNGGNSQSPNGSGSGGGSGSSSILLGTATATDNCGTTLVTGIRSDAQPLNAPFPVGITTIQWTVTDAHGHTAGGIQTVSITDDEFPVINGTPGTQTVTNAPGTCGAAVNWTTPVAADNCPGVTLVADHQSGEVFPIGTTTVHYTATDAHGHITTSSFDVVVADTEKPTVQCPSDITVSGNAGLNGAIVTYTIVSADNCGTPSVTTSVASGSYFPMGTTPVTITVTDAAGNQVTCSFTVTVLNNPPVAQPDVATTQEDTPVSGTVLTNDSDADGNEITVTGYTVNSVSYTAGSTATLVEGELVINADGSFTFTPAANYHGPVPVVNYTIVDINGATAGSTLSIQVTPVNDQPVGIDDAATVNEDAVLNGSVRGNDTESGDGGNSWTVVTTTTHGVLTLNTDGTYTYTPAPNFHGTDVFTYQVCDADSDCSTATVTITVNAVNDQPVGVDDAATVNEDAVLNGSVRGNDTESGDGGNSWTVVTTTTHGVLTLNTDGTYTYTPAPNFHGTDVFTYQVCDADGDCSTATVTITVNAVNDQPVGVDDAATVNEDAVLNGSVRGNDTESGDGGN